MCNSIHTITFYSKVTDVSRRHLKLSTEVVRGEKQEMLSRGCQTGLCAEFRQAAIFFCVER